MLHSHLYSADTDSDPAYTTPQYSMDADWDDDTGDVHHSFVETEAELMDGRRYTLRSSSSSASHIRHHTSTPSAHHDSKIRSYRSVNIDTVQQPPSVFGARKSLLMTALPLQPHLSPVQPQQPGRRGSVIDRLRRRIESFDLSQPNTQRDSTDSSDEIENVNSNGKRGQFTQFGKEGGNAEVFTLSNSNRTERASAETKTYSTDQFIEAERQAAAVALEPAKAVVQPPAVVVEDKFHATKQWINSFFGTGKPVVAKQLSMPSVTPGQISQPVSPAPVNSAAQPIDLTDADADPFADYDEVQPQVTPVKVKPVLSPLQVNLPPHRSSISPAVKTPLLPIASISPVHTLQQRQLIQLSNDGVDDHRNAHNDNTKQQYSSDVATIDLIVPDRVFGTLNNLHTTSHCRMFIDATNIRSMSAAQQYSYRLDILLQHNGSLHTIYQTEIQQKCDADVTFKPAIVQCEAPLYERCVCVVELYRWPVTALLWSDEPTLFGTCKTTLSAICNNVDCTKMPMLDSNKRQICMVTAKRVAAHTSVTKIRASISKPMSAQSPLKQSQSVTQLPRRKSSTHVKSPLSKTQALSQSATKADKPVSGYVSFSSPKAVSNSRPGQMSKSVSAVKLRR